MITTLVPSWRVSCQQLSHGEDSLNGLSDIVSKRGSSLRCQSDGRLVNSMVLDNPKKNEPIIMSSISVEDAINKYLQHDYALLEGSFEGYIAKRFNSDVILYDEKRTWDGRLF